ncbi:MAG: hypothetical protein JWO63_311 [Frankiales bacterium]|jgi:uncharacterized OB-fold protein|nr:hypothetical protein [Frankiales bacterium]
MSTPASLSPPIPAPTPLTAFFWESLTNRQLSILRCQNCGNYVHYPRPICNVCLSEDLAPEVVSGKGTLYAHTWATQAFHPYYVDKLPYCLAVVELPEQPGLRITSNIIDTPREQVHGGMALEVVFHEISPGLTLPLFVAEGFAPVTA